MTIRKAIVVFVCVVMALAMVFSGCGSTKTSSNTVGMVTGSHLAG